MPFQKRFSIGMSGRRDPFDALHARYDAWFTRHRAAYESELLAVRAFLPGEGLGLEIGVGTGRFAVPLGIKVGLDPSEAMLAYARARGVLVIQGKAESLPFAGSTFDFILMVTTICFVADVKAMLLEAKRVLQSRAPLIIGFVDKDSAMGREYLLHKEENVFYREATFYSATEVEGLLREAGFEKNLCWGQTLFHPLSATQEVEPFKKGRGIGGFAVVSAHC